MFYSIRELESVAYSDPEALILDMPNNGMMIISEDASLDVVALTPEVFLATRLRANDMSLDKLAEEIYESTTVSRKDTIPLLLLIDLTNDSYNARQLIIDDYDAELVSDYLAREMAED